MEGSTRYLKISARKNVSARVVEKISLQARKAKKRGKPAKN